MFTALCMKCRKTCKQPVTVKLVHCPLFEPRIDFEDDLMGQLKKFERDASALKARTEQLLAEAVRVVRNGAMEEEQEEEPEEEPEALRQAQG